MRITITCILFLSFFVACKKEPESFMQLTDCFTPQPDVQLDFLGITAMDSVFVRSFEQGSGFGIIKEQRVLKIADKKVENSLFRNMISDFRLEADYDYEILVPKTNDTFRISGIHYTDKVDTNYFSNARTRPVVCEDDDYGISSVSHNGKDQYIVLKHPAQYYHVLSLWK